MSRARLSGLTAIAIVLALQAAVCLAQESEPSPARRARPADSVVAEKLRKFYDAYLAEDHAEARRRGEELLRSRLSPFEIGNVERVLASIDQNEERWADAREHWRRALASGGLNDPEADAGRYQIALLFLLEERWREGIEAWSAWARTALTPPSPAAYSTLARAHFELEDFEAALEPARKAVELSKQPDAQLLTLLIAIQIRREAYALAVPLQRTLVGLAPLQRASWVQLAGLYQQLGKEAEAAQSLQIAYYGGLLTEQRDLQSLAQLLVQIGIPYRAARILSTAIEAGRITPDARLYRLLGEAWIRAQEYARAIDPLTQAAGLSDEGDLYVRVAQLHAQLESWDACAEALRRAFDKGGLDDPGNAYLLLGIARFRQGKASDARQWLERALESPGSRGAAKGWLQLLDSETVSAPR